MKKKKQPQITIMIENMPTEAVREQFADAFLEMVDYQAEINLPAGTEVGVTFNMISDSSSHQIKTKPVSVKFHGEDGSGEVFDPQDQDQLRNTITSLLGPHLKTQGPNSTVGNDGSMPASKTYVKKLDSSGRLGLGSAYAGKRFRVEIFPDGLICLTEVQVANKPLAKTPPVSSM